MLVAAELYLTKRAEQQLYELVLTPAQARKLRAVFDGIRTEPFMTDYTPVLPIETEFRREGYLGEGKHVAVYYDVRGADPIVRVVAVKVFYKM